MLLGDPQPNISGPGHNHRIWIFRIIISKGSGCFWGIKTRSALLNEQIIIMIIAST